MYILRVCGHCIYVYITKEIQAWGYKKKTTPVYKLHI